MRYYNKYGNHKVTYDGITFDSKRECERYIELKEKQKNGEITHLELQKPFELIHGCTKAQNGIRAERPCKYYADFVYITKDGEQIVEDVKGMKTPEYIIKRKLLFDKYGLAVHEI